MSCEVCKKLDSQRFKFISSFYFELCNKHHNELVRWLGTTDAQIAFIKLRAFQFIRDTEETWTEEEAFNFSLDHYRLTSLISLEVDAKIREMHDDYNHQTT